MSSNTDDREQFLASMKAAREQRINESRQEKAAIRIQSVVRGFVARKKFSLVIREQFDETFSSFAEMDRKNIQLPAAYPTYCTMKKLFLVYEVTKDKQRFIQLCRYLILSSDSTDHKTSCVSVALTKDHIMSWVRLMKTVLWCCCKYLAQLKTDLPGDNKLASLYLHTLVVFTSCNTWGLLRNKKGEALKPSLNQLCANVLSDIVTKGMYSKLSLVLQTGLSRKSPTLRSEPLKAITVVSLRPLINSGFSEQLVSQFIISFLSMPALVYHLQTQAPECSALLLTHKMFERTVMLLTMDRYTRQVFNSLDGICALSLLANVIHLGSLEKQVLVENLLDFTNVVTRVLEKCREYVTSTGKKVSTNHWHPVFGWFSQQISDGMQAAMPHVIWQLQNLWSRDMVRCLFRDLVNMIPADEAASPRSIPNNKDMVAPVKKLLRKLIEKQSAFSNRKFQRLGTPETTVIALVCSLYQSALSTFTQLRTDILSGLCREDFLLPKLWNFIRSIGPQDGLKAFLDLLAENPKATSPEFQILSLFCDTAACVITILDETELYEQGKPFTKEELAAMARFVNVFAFRAIWDGIVDVKSVSSHSLLNAVHNLDMVLYHRDCRRQYTTAKNAWLIGDVKSSTFLNELDKNNKKAQILVHRMPHIIPHKDRVVLFRKYVRGDRESRGLLRDQDSFDIPSTLITVHRSRLVEDGYRQLSLLDANALKGIIRVKFINEQGLDEAGIDQDGVFKEFLEETIRKVFDPTLNLFKSTSDGRLYPSSTSNIHENYLALFDFVGRMLGKAMYEGIVVDVPFAFFFLSNLLGKRYSALDELPSLDPELYKNLTYVKHYDGDITELELTFSCDEDCLGQIVTHDLVPGGRTISVNNENKITYIHKMAAFRMVDQIKGQVNAFVSGFHAIIPSCWLVLFSSGELQKLISGDSDDIDLSDLRRNTQYYGGFHNNHKLINWLWDVLENDYSAEERRLFVKFVTSCSKSPLFGFAHLEPPFSIRCVEVSDEHDQGDTLGSVIRGFLAIKRKEPATRLPTSSTCFNLLKLPNYQKKVTLREKLRYAIHSGTGFELS